jgi:transcriptional regulator with XRE-family HTH domain
MKRWANDIGHHLAKIRISRGLTQEQLAAKIQIKGAGMSRQVIANIEARRRRVYEQHLRAFVKVLRCSYDELFLGPQPPKKSSSHQR